MYGAELFAHLGLKRVNPLVQSVDAPVHSIKAPVDDIEPPIDTVQPSFDMREALTYFRELRSEPRLERSADSSDSNFLRFSDTLYCDTAFSLRATAFLHYASSDVFAFIRLRLALWPRFHLRFRGG
jgi:hypothetical protein